VFNNVGWNYGTVESSSKHDPPTGGFIAAAVGKALLQPIFLFVYTTVMGMMITYIVQLRARLARLVNENLNLLNRMHEGLVMLTEKDRKLFFASTPAATLLN